VRHRNKKEHAHQRGCNTESHVMERIVSRAPNMGGPARAAALAWFCVLAGRVAGSGGPAAWTRGQRAAYLKKIGQVARAIVERGTEVELTDVIERLARQLRKILRQFKA
jgi:hypothetical protein